MRGVVRQHEVKAAMVNLAAGAQQLRRRQWAVERQGGLARQHHLVEAAGRDVGKIECRRAEAAQSRDLLLHRCEFGAEFCQAAASANTQMVRPSIPPAMASSDSRSLRLPRPSRRRVAILCAQPVPSRQGEHCPQDSGAKNLVA